MTRLAAILTATLLAACAATYAAEEPPPSVPFEPWMLAHGTTMFAFMPVGFAGTYTEEYLRVEEIAESDDAEEQFLAYLDSDDPGIRLYGMLGLHMIESPEYPRALAMMLEDHSPVNVGGGCLIGVKPASEAASEFAILQESLRLNAENGG